MSRSSSKLHVDQRRRPSCPPLVTLFLVLALGVSGSAASAAAGHVVTGGDRTARGTTTPWVTLASDASAPDDVSGEPIVLPGFDVTSLEARRTGTALEFRFQFADLPVYGEEPSPDAPPHLSFTVNWWLNTDRNSDEWFVVADIDAVSENFWVGWLADDLSDSISYSVEGEYNAAEDYVSILVPVKLLGRRGTVLSNCRIEVFPRSCTEWNSENDIAVYAHPHPHQHAEGENDAGSAQGTPFYDYMSTDRSYRIP